MNRLTTYVHDYPVRNSGVGYPAVVRKLAEYEDAVPSPAEVLELKNKLLAALVELEEYQAIGSKRLFQLLIGKYKNGEI